MTESSKSNVMLDRIISISLIVFCGIMHRIADDYPAGGDYFPKFSLGVIMVMAALMLALTFRSGKTPEVSGLVEAKKTNFKPLILTGLFILYLLIYPKLGFYVSTALFTGLAMAFFKVRRLKLYLTVIPALMLAFYVFFGLILKVPFPDCWLI